MIKTKISIFILICSLVCLVLLSDQLTEAYVFAIISFLLYLINKKVNLKKRDYSFLFSFVLFVLSMYIFYIIKFNSKNINLYEFYFLIAIAEVYILLSWYKILIINIEKTKRK